MSGDHFDSNYVSHIEYIANGIEDYLYGHETDDCELQDYITGNPNDDDEEAEYVLTHRHTRPNRNGYRFQTLQQMKRAVKTLRKAAVYAQRIDWLLSGGDSEESFMARLISDLKAVKQGREVDYSK